MAWQTLQHETLLDSRWVKVSKDWVKLPNGQEIDDFYTVTIPDAAGIVALTPDMEVLLKSEYRYACGETLIETPAGTFEPSETDALAVAKRELLEETGYVSDQWTYLGATVESSSKLTNRMHLFLALDCHQASDQKLDATEVMEVLKMPMQQAVDMVMRNEICCNSTAHGLLRAARMLGI